MRQASLNIRLKDLKTLIDNYDGELSDLYDYLVYESRNYPLNRSIILLNSRTAKKVVQVSSNYTELFNRSLESSRTALGHKFKSITPTDKQYLLLSDIAKDAENFCEVFDLDPESGVKTYIDIGLKKIGRNYRLNKFVTYKDHIYDSYQRYQVVTNDQNKELTQKLFMYYVKKSKLTDKKQMESIYQMYAHDFVYAAESVLEHNTTFQSWIDSQFAGLKYLDIIPEAYQLHGEEASKRFLKHGKATTTNWREEARKKLKR